MKGNFKYDSKKVWIIHQTSKQDLIIDDEKTIPTTDTCVMTKPQSAKSPYRRNSNIHFTLEYAGNRKRFTNNEWKIKFKNSSKWGYLR